jgi:hypothetical protein
MKKNNKTIYCLTLALFMAALGSAMLAQAQNPPPRLLTLNPPTGLPVIPIMEGWYANDDGSVTISFGFLNRNTEEFVDIPVGSNNFLEPAQFNGNQPTHFGVERQVGAFTVTLPPEMKNENVWWTIKTGSNEVLKVPGRAGSGAYQLDRSPRPQGTVEPLAWLEEGGPKGIGPDGVSGSLAAPVKAGTPVTLTVHTMDPSVRDAQDPRFKEPLSLRVNWFHHQGPGKIEFSRHEDHPLPELTEAESARQRVPPALSLVTLPKPEGTAKVIVTFSEPGEYMLRARIDNWNAPDSSAGNQCCWTNVYQKVTVLP